MRNALPPPAKREVVLLPIRRVIFSNDRPNKAVIRDIVEQFDEAKWRPVCAHATMKGYILTDGNHRTEAARQMGSSHVPAVLLTKREFDYVAFSDRRLDIPAFLPDRIAVLA